MVVVACCREFHIGLDPAFRYISSANNNVCDCLSRGAWTLNQQPADGVIFPQSKGLMEWILTYCDPLSLPSSDEMFLLRWRELLLLLHDPTLAL